MAIHDVSVALTDAMPVWPGDPPASIRPALRIRNGDPANVTRIDIGTHTGTHVDAPWHFEDDGITVDQLDLDVLVGRARVVEFSGSRPIDAAMLARVPLGDATRVLFKTENSALWARGGFHRDFVGLAPDGARYLVDRGVRLVGIDYLSIEPFGSTDFATHHTLLRRGVVIVEGLDLSNLKAADYDLVVLPLKIAGADGSPARAILRDIADR
ncbi:MAG: cyclase family protein [Planctomycetes bacterium]|nr:cyclase family protein [Planctomycetota bacterium]MBI3846068.1 cyclase family protein [Planctomycetota bacterium]